MWVYTVAVDTHVGLVYDAAAAVILKGNQKPCLTIKQMKHKYIEFTINSLIQK